MTLEAWYMPSAGAKAAIAASELLDNSTISHNSPSTKGVSKTSHGDSEAWQERAAIIEHDSKIPREWAEAFARICVMLKPAGIGKTDWQRIMDSTGYMLDDPTIMQALVANGWAVDDVFSVHPAAPTARIDSKGLLLLMRDGEKITSVTQQAIGLQRKGGAEMLYRRPIAPCPERIMLWELK